MTQEQLGRRLKTRLTAGGFVLGASVGFVRTPALMRMIGGAGYDFVFIDMQHSSLSSETVADMCEMARAAGLAPIVRPASHAPEVGGRVLDLGATGLMHFDVTSRQQVDAFLEWMRCTPEGTRTVARGALSDHGDASGADLHRLANDNLVLVAQVESREGVERIGEILEGGGIDVVEVGRLDLSASLGVPSERRHPSVLDALDTVIAAAQRHGVAVGAGCDSVEDAEDLLGRGVRWITTPADRAILRKAYAEYGLLRESFEHLAPGSA